jgi:parvulin-like peptidyl-prolyl isomerase
MVDRDSKRIVRRWLGRSLVAVGGLATALAAFSSARQPAPSASAPAQTAPAPQAAPAATPDSDYGKQPVAFIGRDSVITREELGEFLVLRRGAEKVDQFVDRRIVDMACKEAGVEVTAGEIEASLAKDLKDLGGITQSMFVKQVLRRYNKTLVEWKEDVIRPKLQMSKLCQARIQVTEEDIRAAFEARYGEKIECRIIQWAKRPKKEDDDRVKAAAEAACAKMHANDQLFDELARHQEVGPLAATGGKIKPLNRHLAAYNPPFQEKKANDLIESTAFQLQPGEVSTLLEVPGCYMVVRCDRRVPADTAINPAAVREEIVNEVTERKTLAELPKVADELRKKAKPTRGMGDAATANTLTPFVPGSSHGRVVAYVYGNVPVTREDLGEFLITRYGASALELLVNKHIIDDEAKAKGVRVEPAEIETALAEKIAAYGGKKGEFDKALAENHVTPAQYREDVLRPQLLLTKMSADRVKVTDADLEAAYAAYFGEKIECRLILWPREERKIAMNEYAALRDSEQSFAEKAGRQSSPELAKNHGHLMDGDHVRLIGRHTLGNTDLERELFSLHDGEVSKLVETPEGIVVMKCDRHVPADPTVTPSAVRPKLLKEVTERKIQVEIPLLFAELRKQAEPRLLLKDPNKPIDLEAEVKHDLAEGGAAEKAGGKGRSGKAPAGN